MKTVLCPEGWSSADAKLTRIFHFASFRDAIAFINDVATLSEQNNHHPDITINYCKVTLSLTTHDAGGLTEKDFVLAVSINALPV
jgi:4a-hydroxytetrahydrobiopterin dehydratase